MTKKLISFLLTISILLSTVLFANAAQTDINTSILDGMMINPLYEDTLSEADALEMLKESKESYITESSNNTDYSMESQTKSAVIYGIRDSAAAYVRDQMVARKPTIQYSFKTKSTDVQGLFTDIYYRAMSEELSVGTSDGDYLKWHWGVCDNANVSYYTSGGYYVFTSARTHIFSHIEWKMQSYLVGVEAENTEFLWIPLADIQAKYAIPTAFLPFLKEL